MNDEKSFRALWEQQEFEVPDAPDDLCEYAKQFAAWVAQVIADVEKNPSLVAVNHAFLYLVHKYFEWRVVVPRNHRNRMGVGHTCIFHVFEAGYMKLRVIQLALQPPPLTMTVSAPPAPSTPPPIPPLQIAGIFFGEDDE